jgi:RNA polymerase sigma-70 factor (ECF subfamily)
MLPIAMNTLSGAGHEASEVMSAIVARHAVYTDTSSISLVASVRDGDNAALAELYDQHAGALLAFARRLLGDHAAAEDLVHEVFIAAPSAFGRFQGQASVRTFLISIAVNHARHHLRSASRRRAATERFAREPESMFSGTPEEQLGRHGLAQALNSALDQLPLDQRVAFVLCEVEERTSREAAEIVGVPEATVRTRLFHAKRKLRDELAERGIR